MIFQIIWKQPLRRNNLQTREAMAYASYYVGLSLFTSTNVGYVHGPCASALGALCHLPHGLANALSCAYTDFTWTGRHLGMAPNSPGSKVWGRIADSDQSAPALSW